MNGRSRQSASWLLLVACLMAPLAVHVAPAQAQGSSSSSSAAYPSDAERAIATAVVPGLARGSVIAGARTALGTPALAPPAATEQWYLWRVESQSVKVARLPKSKKADKLAAPATWALVWLLPADADGTQPYFMCPSCVSVALPALLDSEGGLLAVGAPLRATGHEDLRLESPMQLGKTTVWPIRWHWRHKGVWEQRLLGFERAKTRLEGQGDVPVFYSNEGRCGRVADVAERGRPIGKKSECGTVFRFRAALSTSSKGIRAKETLRVASARRYESDTKKATVTHQLRRGRWNASRRSLRERLPNP